MAEGFSKVPEIRKAKTRKLHAKATEMKSVLGNIQNSTETLNRITAAEKKIQKLQNEMEETSRNQQKIGGKVCKEMTSPRKLWDEFKRNKLRITRISEEQKKQIWLK